MKQHKKIFIALCIIVVVIDAVVIAVVLRNTPIAFEIAQPASGTVRIPLRFEPGAVKKDITYCGTQKLDLYQPRLKVYDKQPVVMYIHGGGWHKNNKSSEPDQFALIEGLRDKGFAIVSINYRQQPNDTFPAPVEDAMCAVRFLRTRAAEYQLDPDNIAVFGYSAGGHLAAMVGVLDTIQFNNGQYADVSSRVKAVVTLAGVFNFNEGLKTSSKINIKNLMQSTPYSLGQPISYVTPDDPAFLLIHGGADSVVMLKQDELFASELRRNNVPYQTVVVKNAEHGLSRFGGEISPSKDEVASKIHSFIIQQLSL